MSRDDRRESTIFDSRTMAMDAMIDAHHERRQDDVSDRLFPFGVNGPGLLHLQYQRGLIEDVVDDLVAADAVVAQEPGEIRIPSTPRRSSAATRSGDSLWSSKRTSTGSGGSSRKACRSTPHRCTAPGSSCRGRGPCFLPSRMGRATTSRGPSGRTITPGRLIVGQRSGGAGCRCRRTTGGSPGGGWSSGS